LYRSGSSHPFSPSQCRIAVPSKKKKRWTDGLDGLQKRYIRHRYESTSSPTDPLGQGTAAGRLNFVLGHQIADVMVLGQPS